MDGSAVGFAMVDFFGDFAHLEEIDVDPGFMRRGVASRLLEEVIDYCGANNKRHLSLRTFKTTKWSIGLYEKFGFVPVDSSTLDYLKPHIENENARGLPLNDRISMCLILL